MSDFVLYKDISFLKEKTKVISESVDEEVISSLSTCVSVKILIDFCRTDFAEMHFEEKRKE